MFSSSLSLFPHLFFLTPVSIDLLHFPNDLFFKDGQDCIIFTHLLKHHTAVELVAHFLEVIPGKGGKRVENGSHLHSALEIPADSNTIFPGCKASVLHEH